MTPDAEIWGPKRLFAGYQQISEKIEAFHAHWPDCRLVLASGLNTFQNAARLGSAIIDADGAVLTSGHAVIELADDGRISRVLPFWDPLPALPAEWPEQFSEFTTTRLPSRPSELAPDGSAVSPLLAVAGGSMAHFQLDAGETAHAVAHRTVEKLWFVLGGRGELWRKRGTRESIVVLQRGVCVTLPRGTHFQFRASLTEPVEIVAVTMPRWPGSDEAELVHGPWPASAQRSPTATAPELTLARTRRRTP
jgi:mannose-6-phosphate isomerase-like protein (cupin superfamily)